ncbi:hypothetical protein VP01_3766g3 [Puccinia sorghi]|uniref:Uncharacterized protein n=1 Tax=Puccinia sorghi TaxID=27349 RepID=A0A0L6UVN8_9BASI|nr:hypothetical protein VP01_3766g3 [Puccinia sorghi]
MVPNSKWKPLIMTLEISIKHDLVAMVLAMIVRGYNNISSDKESEDKEDTIDSTNALLVDIKRKVEELCLIQSKKYLCMCQQIEIKAPLISELLLNRLEEKQFRQNFGMKLGVLF